MKYFVAVVLIVFGLSGNAQFSKASLQASGLTCSMCTKAIMKALAKIPFVQEVKTSIEDSQFDLIFRSNEPISPDAIKNAVQDAGFSIISLKLTGRFDSVWIDKGVPLVAGAISFYFLNSGRQLLDGEITLMLAEKDFLSPRDYKKYSVLAKQKENSKSMSVYHVVL